MENNVLQTELTNLLKERILGANTTYTSICHNDHVIKNYEIKKDFKPHIEPIFKLPGSSVRDKMYEILENLYKEKKILNYLNNNN